MTELATIQPTNVGVASIEETARALVSAHQIATALCNTAFVPKHFQGKPDDAAAAILYGSTIDMDPVTALQNIFVIGGKPALYARTMVAIVLSKGHEIWTEEESEGSVTVAGRRKGSSQMERVTWTTDMAQRAGYMTNSKYKTDPRSMLYARASGDVARRIAPDALLGMAHNVEELTISEVTQSPSAPSSQVDRMRSALRPEPEPTVTVEQIEPETGELITSSQTKKMGALMREVGVGDRDTALAYVADVIGREVASRSDLTKAEASQVIESLESDRAAVAPEGVPDA